NSGDERYYGAYPEDVSEHKSHAKDKALYHAYQGLGYKGIEKIAGRTIAKATEKEIAPVMTKLIEEAAAKNINRANGTIASRMTEGVAKGVEKTAEVLIKEGKLGKGIITPTIREISKAEGNIIKGMSASYKQSKAVIVNAVGKQGALK